MDTVRHDPEAGQRPLNGSERKRRGMALAAGPRERLRLIVGGCVAMLAAGLSRPDRVCSTDDIPDGGGERAAAGKWAGTCPQRLATAGVVKRVGYAPSRRPTRHATPIGQWQLVADDAAAAAHLARLRAELAALEAADAPDAQPAADTSPATAYDLFAALPGGEG